MPFPNYHSCRLADPDKFTSFAYKKCAEKHAEKCMDVDYGILAGKSEIQALRFDKDVWTAADAQAECTHRGGSFHAAKMAASMTPDEIAEMEMMPLEEGYLLAVWMAADVNDLPDSAFLHIEDGGTKDGDGKTVPRSLRHFPYKDSAGSIDLPHLRNAIARIPQSNLPQSVKDVVQAKAQKLLEKINAKAASAIVVENEDPYQFAVSSASKNDAGVTIQKFKKDMLKVGTYTHPIEGWTLEVTPEKLQHYLSNFQKMRQDGVDVEVPLNHSFKAEDNLGYVIDGLIEPDEKGIPTFFGIYEIRGDKAIDIVSRNKNVSVWIANDFVDGKKNHYGEAIVHSSVVQQPVVSGQGEFVAIAASLLGDLSSEKLSNVPILRFCSKENDSMDPKFLSKIKELLGEQGDITAENVLAKVGEKITSLAAELTAEKGKVESLKLSRTPDKSASLEPNVAENIAKTAEKELGFLVRDGKITPAVEKRLSAALIGAVGSRNSMALSLRGEKSDKPSVIDEVVAALKENDLVKLGEQTGAQVKILSRVEPDAAGKADAESGKAMQVGAGVVPKK